VKLLYVAPENVSGGFSLFARGHRARGNECRWITFFPNRFGFEEDLCFDLAMTADRDWVRRLRLVYRSGRGESDIRELAGSPPFWNAGSAAEALWFSLRDRINSPRIERAIEQYGLNDFDIYHFEQGIDPYRDGRWGKKLKAAGKKIVSFYHGSDLRNRGVIRPMLEVSDLNLTSEIDLLDRLPGMRYLFLPIDTDGLTPQPRTPDGRIRIGHAARNRAYKGSDDIERIVAKLAERYPIDWVMIENRTNDEALAMKRPCDIFIDQITDLGGWGYGVSSIESLALGIATVTRINSKVAEFIPDHPFVSADKETLERELERLIADRGYRKTVAERGREWVVRRHSLESVMNSLYDYYRLAGFL